MQPRTWDVFCRVVDNFGDIGVCWRLASDLASRGEAVRLWADDVSALAWMAPAGAASVSVSPWHDETVWPEPGDVVIEAFGCNPPPAFVQRMAMRPRAPVWINLEYLSAEPYVERSHLLRSPQTSGAAAGLVKWFFYPGFTPATGGLIREPDLAARKHEFDGGSWLRSMGIERREGERLVSLFCYAQPDLPRLLAPLGATPTRLLVTAGIASREVERSLDASLRHGALQSTLLPALSQRDYDHLLWSCDLNIVRGEDSFVRAQWAERPFIWNIYPQSDGAHAAKLRAFLARFTAGTEPAVARDIAALWQAWNGLASAASTVPESLLDLRPWQACAASWAARLRGQTDLTSQLIEFAANSP